eukprot:3890879-Amphidinium_carterae.1
MNAMQGAKGPPKSYQPAWQVTCWTAPIDATRCLSIDLRDEKQIRVLRLCTCTSTVESVAMSVSNSGKGSGCVSKYVWYALFDLRTLGPNAGALEWTHAC